MDPSADGRRSAAICATVELPSPTGGVHIVMMMMMMTFYYILPMRTVSQRTLEAAVDGDMAGGFQDEGASRNERCLLVNLSYRRDQSILLFHPLFL